MIEIPAAVLLLPLFLKRMDFLSIGTNDLIQYTLAIDRADNAVAHLYDPLHPAVLQLIARTIHRSQPGRRAGGCVRRDGGRPGHDAAAAGHGPAGVLDAPGATAAREAGSDSC